MKVQQACLLCKMPYISAAQQWAATKAAKRICPDPVNAPYMWSSLSQSTSRPSDILCCLLAIELLWPGC